MSLLKHTTPNINVIQVDIERKHFPRLSKQLLYVHNHFRTKKTTFCGDTFQSSYAEYKCGP